MSPKSILSLLLAACVAACSPSAQEQAPAAVPVKTIRVAPQDIDNTIELPGRVEAVRVAEVRARVTGIVQQRLFEEGSDVGKGQPLFRIDPAELRASYAQTSASLDRAKATAANANAVVARYRPLVAENAISGQEFDAAQAAAREASANLAQMQAQLRAASLQLGYTTVRAPISGRAGRATITEGGLVSQGEATLMTRIEQMSPVYVSFSQSASEILKLRRALASGELALGEDEPVEVRVSFSDGSEYGVPGVIDFFDFSVDEDTGTIQLRAEFANPDGLLLPGEFVRARLFAGKLVDVITVPQRAVTATETGGTVLIVDKDGKAARNAVKLGKLIGDDWVIEGGLEPGTQVIISNLQKLSAGTPVKIVNGGAAATARAD
ncbi:efflux RND transporter periplasmic adaptor subunit [Aurantiacibacter rhizosphaerae]|uniref:Efflux RND transporter periplasmic adaptor subunit n=1 Tax=Aurantiacibacter rhizosphaerae TaxID=2691582 RepID=A0A844XBQ6_9SPHN|nr:efflux RND transporter periplasmic adaptor subunit [Aurantiacibacter rhizosphaerae]MWV27142.1 efflux RND transporter periplasmic adaptor subunit [Aurantiacibacter rhizosphaerae]